MIKAVGFLFSNTIYFYLVCRGAASGEDAAFVAIAGFAAICISWIILEVLAKIFFDTARYICYALYKLPGNLPYAVYLSMVALAGIFILDWMTH
jgi:hypothetical protein